MSPEFRANNPEVAALKDSMDAYFEAGVVDPKLQAKSDAVLAKLPSLDGVVGKRELH